MSSHAPTPVFRFLSELRACSRSTLGGIAAITAIVSPIIVGAMGLGSEVGYWYLLERRVQNAADVSAHAAAIRKHGGDDAAAYTAMANYVAENARVDMTRATLTVNSPPLSGSLTASANAVEVVVTDTVPRMFSALYREGAVSMAGRSVAFADGGGPGCIIALSPTVQGAITISGSANMTLTGCDLVSNAEGLSFDMNGTGSSVNARCVQAVGVVQATNSLTTECDVLRERASPAPDPYASVTEPALGGTCNNANVGQNNQNTTLSPTELHPSGMPVMRFCNGLSMRGNVSLNPGIYIVEGGDFRLNANTFVQGSGVFFYLADGVEMNFNGTADMDLAAPTTGPYAGMLVFGSRTATTMSHTINGDAGVVMDGAIYTPASHLDFIGNTATSAVSCTQIIGNTVGFSGNGAISITCTNTAGNDAHTGLRVWLVE